MQYDVVDRTGGLGMLNIIVGFACSLLLLLSILGAGVLYALDSYSPRMDPKKTATAFMMGVWIIYGIMWYHFQIESSAFQFQEQYPWIPSLGAVYHVGIDGISLIMIGMTFVINTALIWMTEDMPQSSTAKSLAVVMMMQICALGLFMSMDAVLFYVFWESALLPLFMAIGIWGSSRRIAASFKLFLFTFTGSVLFLVALVYCGYIASSSVAQDGGLIFDMYAWRLLPLTGYEQMWLFWAFMVAFAVKVPLLPLHTWLPDAHPEAPTFGSVILAALTLKFGAYAMIRFILPVVPDAARIYAPVVLALSVLAVIYVGLLAWVQTDAKKLIAYSSIAHMAVVIAGLFLLYQLPLSVGFEVSELSIVGSVIQMFAHALSSAGLFYAFGLVYKRGHTRLLHKYSGLMQSMPIWSLCFFIFALNNIALPGLSGFVGEAMVLLAAFQASVWLALGLSISFVFAPMYTLSLAKQLIFGHVNTSQSVFKDISIPELQPMFLLAVVALAVGMYPSFLVDVMKPTASEVVKMALRSKL
ncbi:MAG: NADH-quinone oxidoreductase subunit M [Pseudomonadota bacterium]|nr:NADH-quinone oxidoreductase subunit M [Pseudomonadota bacterium]